MNAPIKAVGLVLAMGLVLGTSACGSDPTNSEPAPATNATGAPADPGATPGGDQGGQASAQTKKFGSTFTWDDGVVVTVGQPKVFKPDPMVKSMQQNKELDEYVVVEVQVENGTSEPLSPLNIGVQATSGEADAEAVFDSEAGVDLPTADILPGKTKKWKAAFARKKGEDFVVQVSNITGGTGYYQE